MKGWLDLYDLNVGYGILTVGSSLNVVRNAIAALQKSLGEIILLCITRGVSQDTTTRGNMKNVCVFDKISC